MNELGTPCPVCAGDDEDTPEIGTRALYDAHTGKLFGMYCEEHYEDLVSRRSLWSPTSIPGPIEPLCGTHGWQGNNPWHYDHSLGRRVWSKVPH